MRVSIMLLTVLVCVFSALGQDNSTQQNNSFTKSDSLRKNPESFGNQSNTDKKRKFEVGIQFTSMMREGDGDRNGLGGRFGYDFATFNGGKYVATAEAEVNFLPGDRFVGYRAVSASVRAATGALPKDFSARKSDADSTNSAFSAKFAPVLSNTAAAIKEFREHLQISNITQVRKPILQPTSAEFWNFTRPNESRPDLTWATQLSDSEEEPQRVSTFLPNKLCRLFCLKKQNTIFNSVPESVLDSRI